MSSSNNNDDFFLLETESTELQQETLRECLPFFVDLDTMPKDQVQHLIQVGLLLNYQEKDICLLKEKHATYLSRPMLSSLNSSFVSLDSSRPWILYWTLHGMDLLNQLPDNNVLLGIVATIQACWQTMTTFSDTSDAAAPIQTGGGFGGGPGQMAHCAPTYAAVMVLAMIACSAEENSAKEAALSLLQDIRMPLWHWFLTLKQPHGGFRMHDDGEVDVRATYTIVACVSLLHLPTKPLLDASVIEFVASCQTFEGGFGGEPYNEAHGGYTYCALAALELLGAASAIQDLNALRGWLARRQMSIEGGFHGRSNKLVDGCYSFWQGAAMTILSRHFDQKRPTAKSKMDPRTSFGYDPKEDYWLNYDKNEDDNDLVVLYDQAMLQRYILTCAQDVHGGLRDKPSKPRDFYHSCYNLSGLSVSQQFSSSREQQYGHKVHSRVVKTHACFNIKVHRVEQMVQHFYGNDAMTDKDESK